MKKIIKKLRPYQMDALRYAKSVTNPCLLLDMRLGKTLITIRTIRSYAAMERRSILVVCPLSAIDGWLRELKSENQNSVSVLTGTKKNRLKELNYHSQWNVMNYEGSRPLLNELKKANFDILVLDESPIIKNPRAKVSKYFVNNFRNTKHRFILTGTPDPESDMDFIQQLNFADKDILGGKNYYQLRNSICHSTGFGFKIRPKNLKWFRDRISQYCYSLKRTDVNLEQERIEMTRTCVLPPRLRKAYNTVEDEMILELGDELKYTNNSLAALTWMRQLASGIIDGKMESNHKLKELDYLIENDLKGQQVVIWASYVAEIKMIEQHLAKKYTVASIHGEIKQTERNHIKSLFNDGTLSFVVINPEVFKYGTDLSAADTMIYFSLPQSAETYKQSRDRTVKVGSTKSLLSIYLITSDTVDEAIYYSLKSKTKRSTTNHEIFKFLRSRNKK